MLNSSTSNTRIFIVSLFLLFAITWGALPFHNAYAINLGNNFQIHGFLTQAGIHTSRNNFFGSSEDNLSLDFRELGINGSWRPLANLQLSAQGLARWAGDGDDGIPRLDYGFADYSVISTTSNQLGIRLGRIVNPWGLYNDTRDVAFTRPSILLPQSIYFDRTRDLGFSADGGQLYGVRSNNYGDFSLQLNSVYPRVGESSETILLGPGSKGELGGDLSLVGRLLYQRDGGRITLGISGLDVNFDYDSTSDPMDLPPGSINFRSLILSAQYNALKWSLTGEYALRNFSYEGFVPFIPNTDTTGESYYIQGVYRFLPGWEAFARYDVLYSDRSDRHGRQYEMITGKPFHTRFAKDITVGLRWDVTPNFMLRAEFHHIDGTGWLTLEDNEDLSDLSRNWNLLAVLASLRF